MNAPATESIAGAGLSRADIKKLTKADLQREEDLLAKEEPIPPGSAKRPTVQPAEESKQPANKIYSCKEFLAIVHENTTPLIGSENDALLVRGEGLMIPGTGGVGKTLLLNALAFHLATGENFLKWQIQNPLRVLFYQAELPAAFFQKRLIPLFEVYALADQRKAALIHENIFIADLKRPFDISGEIGGFESVTSDVERLQIDVVIIDPFLSFFLGNENDNNEVRRSLDNIKREVAEKHQCGLIISDHMPKYSGSDKNPEQHFSMRGASAKRDWAASVVALTKMKTPDGQHGTFIQATVDKMRYGKTPKNPFSLRRDEFSFRHDLVRNSDIPLHDIARILDESGSGLSKRTFTKSVSDAFSISEHESRKLIDDAISEGWILTLPGERRSIIHNISDRYLEYRDGQ